MDSVANSWGSELVEMRVTHLMEGQVSLFKHIERSTCT